MNDGFAVRQLNNSVQIAFDKEPVGTLDGMAAMILGEALLNESKAASLATAGAIVPKPLVHLAGERLMGVSARADGDRVVLEWAGGAKRVVMPADYAERLGRLIHQHGVAAWEHLPSSEWFGQDAREMIGV